MINTNEIFNIKTNNDFKKYALEIFRFQAQNNKTYNNFLKLNSCNFNELDAIEKIPFLPIEFFKSFKIITGKNKSNNIFISSGTSGSKPSKHYVSDIDLYKKSFIKGFEQYYGNSKDYCFLALLPTYLERKNSSLVFMMDELIANSKYLESGFYLNDFNKLYTQLKNIEEKNIPTILIGVCFALLDFIEQYKIELKNCIVMETGGMKGKRKEITRDELHAKLKKGFSVKTIHSEYGMTELLSQAYSKGNGLFQTPPWMKVLIRDIYDPKTFVTNNNIGGINIIDLANINSISFIETKDMGRLQNNRFFEVLGRFDESEIRGCNLMISEE